MGFSSSLHRRINVSKDEKSLTPHSDILFSNNVKDFSIFLKDIEKRIFQLLKRNLLIQVTDIESIIGGDITSFLSIY